MSKKPAYDELISRNLQLEKKNRELEKELKRRGNNEYRKLCKGEDNLLLYNEIMDNMAEGVILVRISDFIIIYTNSKFDDMFGYEAGELLNKHIGNIHAEGMESVEKMKLEILNCFEKGTYWRGEVQNIKKDGKYFWSHINISGFEHHTFGEVCIAIHEDITNRKIYEQRIAESEEKFRIISDQSMLGILILQDNILKYANQTASHITEFSFDEKPVWRAEDIYKNIHPDDKAFVMQQVEKKQTGDKHVVPHYATRIITKTNNVKWIEIYSRTVQYKNKPADLITMVDITNSKMIEKDLKESEEKFRNLFYNAQGGMFRSRIDGGKFLDLNNKMAEIMGYTRQEMIMMKPSDIWIDKPARKKMLDILDKKGSVSDYEILVKSKDNKIKALVVSVRLYKEYGYIEGNAIDITERKESREALEKSEELYRTLVRTFPDTIVVSDMQGRITFASPQVAKMISNNENENLIGHFLFDMLVSEELGKGKAIFELIKKDGAANNLVLQHIRKDGSIFYGETNASLLKDNRNKPYGIIATTRDITKHIKDEQELIKAKERAIESDRLKSAFLANMSHEIRTPMNGIVGFADLVKEYNISTKKRNKYLDIIVDRSRHLLNIINDIIDISKIEADEITIINKECSLNKTLNNLFTFFDSIKKAENNNDIKLRFTKDLEDNKCFIYTDPVRLQQILTNLLSNAFKFTKKGFIEYGYVVKNKKTLEFYVKDTGVGLTDKEQNIVFDRFRQGEGKDDKITEGTGLGLSISKGLVKLLGGQIWVKAEKGKGSTFYFSIPYKPMHKVQTTQTKTKKLITSNINLEKKTILVVDDDDTSYYFFKEILDKTRARLLWVKDGLKAIKMCRNNLDIDLVLMDIQLPKMDGYEATKRIKQFRQDLPILAETAYALSSEKEKALKAGCDDYLSKPIDRELFMKKIKKLL